MFSARFAIVSVLLFAAGCSDATLPPPSSPNDPANPSAPETPVDAIATPGPHASAPAAHDHGAAPK
ncbi:MAG TPA: hypothetical protein VHB21_13900 [Minicystis sp.]|nr:hypothetical protein [Minicystis sp.]